jgi:hypothetical protein
MFGFGEDVNQELIRHCVSDSLLRLFLSILQPAKQALQHGVRNMTGL